MDGETAKVTVPWFIKAEARDVLKDYTEMLNGRYTNIRFQDASGWKTSALIEFDPGRAKLSPEICAMVITVRSGIRQGFKEVPGTGLFPADDRICPRICCRRRDLERGIPGMRL